MTTPTGRWRAFTAVRAVWGVALCVAPGRLVRATGSVSDRSGRATLRVLGARHLAQAALIGQGSPTPLKEAGAGVDAVHAATAGIFATLDARHRRVAAADAVVAAEWAVRHG